MKKRERDDVDTPASTTSTVPAPATVNRPKAGRKGPSGAPEKSTGGAKPSGSGSTDSQETYTSTLEARLNNLEALLRSIPPGVHNALINKLDGQLSAGAEPGPSTDVSSNMQGVVGTNSGTSAPEFAHLFRQQGSSLGRQTPMQVPANAAQGAGVMNSEQVNQLNMNNSGINLANLGLPQSAFVVDRPASNGGASYDPNFQTAGGFNGLNANALHKGNVGLGSYSIGMMRDNGLATSSADNYSGNPMAGLTFGDFDLNQPTLEDFTAEQDDNSVLDALNDVERGMEGLNLSNGYLYVDEIGQTKWQGTREIGFVSRNMLSQRHCS